MKKWVLMMALCVAPGTSAIADTLLLDGINASPANSGSGVMRPKRGATMSEVTAQFGEPKTTKGPIGEPPISRWEYPAYTVYFEYDRVINAVVHR
jgi:hypothetical protein